MVTAGTREKQPRGALRQALVATSVGLGATALLLRGVAPLEAYDENTVHQTLTRRALELATRGGSYAELTHYQGKIVNGAMDEDQSPRFVHHFFDPKTGLGLPRNLYTILFAGESPSTTESEIRYSSALDWARDGMPDHLDWEGAIAAYDYSQPSRQKAYEALGHVVHLLQDMAQPDHARCRPHPGNYARDKVSQWLDHPVIQIFAPGEPGPFLDYMFPSDRVGYEKLWALNDGKWPRGKNSRKPSSLTGAFRELAEKAKVEEGTNGLLRRVDGEIALGLGPLRVDNVELGVSTVINPAAIPAMLVEMHKVWTLAQYAKFHDNFWLSYEMDLPLYPIIPWPAKAQTQPYLKLGETLLPLAEEHSAGLMQLFHDIVNPPPYVQSVEILQKGERKYFKEWVDSAPDEKGRITGRSARTQGNGVLMMGNLAEVRIRFGPTLLEHGKAVREAVKDVKVWVEPPSTGQPGGAGSAGGPRPPEMRVYGAVKDPETPDTLMWMGQFVPNEGGVLHIEARDTDDHWEGEGRQGDQRGDVLDSNPATPARVTSQPAAAGSRYPWQGYEPGPDTNHNFTVGGECVRGPIPADLLNSRRWGTLRGTLRDSDIRPDGRWDTTREVTCRVALDPSYASYMTSGLDVTAIKPSSFADVGRCRGTYREVRKGSFVDDRDRPHDTTTTGSLGGRSGGTIALGSRDPSKACHYAIYVENVDRTPEGGLREGSGQHVEGETCADGGIQGQEVENLAGGTIRYESSWSFTFTPEEAPGHISLVLKHTGVYRAIFRGSQGYPGEASRACKAAAQEQARANGQARAPLPDPTRALLGSINVLARRARETRPLFDEYDGEWTRLNNAWVSNKPDADTEYELHLEKFSKAFDRWVENARAMESQIATETELLAKEVEQISSDSALTLRQMAQKLRNKGFEAFGLSEGPSPSRR